MTQEQIQEGNKTIKKMTKPVWPNDIRLKMIEKSEFYSEPKIYQYGYYDGFQKGIGVSTDQIKPTNEQKYVSIKVSNIITQIAKETNIKGYTEGIIETFLPDAENMTAKEEKRWIKQNNKRMQAICDFLNSKNL